MENKEFREKVLLDLRKNIGGVLGLRAMLAKALNDRYIYLSPRIDKVTDTCDKVTLNFGQFELSFEFNYKRMETQHIGKDWKTGESKVLSTNVSYCLKNIK